MQGQPDGASASIHAWTQIQRRYPLWSSIVVLPLLNLLRSWNAVVAIAAMSTPVRALHLSQLRTAVDLVRAAAGLPAGTYTDAPIVPNVTVIKTVHVTELRTQLGAALAALGLPAPTFTDSTLAGGSIIRKAHIAELRAAVK